MSDDVPVVDHFVIIYDCVMITVASVWYNTVVKNDDVHKSPSPSGQW